MSNTSPFSLLESLFQAAGTQLQPPAWLVDEGQHRLILLLNHVLMQEPEAQARLARRKGSVLQVQWGAFCLPLQFTAAGLADRAPAEQAPDLVLRLQGPAWSVLQQLVQGQRPEVQIEGDVQLAAEMAWLSDNLRWDIEEDLARLLGDVPAHAIADAARRCSQALRPWLSKAAGAAAASFESAGATRAGA